MSGALPLTAVPGTASPQGIDTAPFAVRPGLFSPAECDGLAALLDRPGRLAGKLAGGANVRTIRACEVLWLDDGPETAWVFEQLARLAADVNRSHFGFDLTNFAEGAQLIRYDGSELGSYDWHVDRGRAAGTRSRKLSISVQLSGAAAYEGGTLELNGEGEAVGAPREQGTAIVFPSFMLHRVTPVTAGRRTALVAWLHGPALR